MVKKKIGLIYSYNREWIAGSYYILNLIHALNIQDDSQKPELVILSNSLEEFKTVQETGYPYLKFHQLYVKKKSTLQKLIERILNKVILIISGKPNFFKDQREQILPIHLDLLFPASTNDYFSSVKNKLFWIPDFQEHFLPQFFSEEELVQRMKHQSDLVDQQNPIVFSSRDALSHFEKLYPNACSPSFVLPFSVTHPPYKHLNVEEVLKKYGIKNNYFFCANQFWAHKNHQIVLSAIKLLKEQGVNNVKVVFSGKETDYRNPNFFNELKVFVATNGLESYCCFLGFIDRDEQLLLMNHAISVIQPSLFEGWSTVVEDIKAMSQHVILSDIPIHREQIQQNALFFNPKNERELATIMKELSMQKPNRIDVNYKQDIKAFGKSFLHIVNKIEA